MLSSKARLFCFMLKHRHLLRFQRKKDSIDWDTYDAVLRFRQDVEKGANFAKKLPAEIKILPVTIGELHAEWILPSQPEKDKVILYFHGGGYVSGTCKSHRVHVAKFVKGSNRGALLFEYRLAPEYTFPAALEDALAAYNWLLFGASFK